MTNHNVITLKLSDVYSLSLVQGKAVTNYADSYAELALIRTDIDKLKVGSKSFASSTIILDVHNAFVPCNAWCPQWVGEDYFEDVVHGCDAHDVKDLLGMAKEFVYQQERG